MNELLIFLKIDCSLIDLLHIFSDDIIIKKNVNVLFKYIYI